MINLMEMKEDVKQDVKVWLIYTFALMEVRLILHNVYPNVEMERELKMSIAMMEMW